MSVNAIRRDDMRPHVYQDARRRRRRGPKSSAGFPRWVRSTSCARIRSSPGCCSRAPNARCISRSMTETTGSRCVMNMPASSVRDLVIHDDDLVVGTHGRSIWILDGITPLRELAEAARAKPAFLFTPPHRNARAMEHVFRYAACRPRNRPVRTRRTAPILDYYLPAASERRDARDRRRSRPHRPALLEPRRAGAYRSVDVAVPDLLAPSAADAFERPWSSPFRVGPALSAAQRSEARAVDCRHLPQHRLEPRLARSCIRAGTRSV